MQLFYTTQIEGNMAHLSEEETRHLRVLRKQEGDRLQFVDGKGGFYIGQIAELNKKNSTLLIQERLTGYGKSLFYLHMAIAPTKKIDRTEWFVEKATEIGVDEITFLQCEHSERKRIRLDRIEKISMSAMKQSKRAYLPKLNDLTAFDQFIEHSGGLGIQQFIAHCDQGEKTPLPQNYHPGQDVTILIGPEGDFSVREVEEALERGYEAISLGHHRLRTETAGIVACHTINLLNEVRMAF